MAAAAHAGPADALAGAHLPEDEVFSRQKGIRDWDDVSAIRGMLFADEARIMQCKLALCNKGCHGMLAYIRLF